MDYINDFIKSQPFLKYSSKNPDTGNEIKLFLIEFYEKNKELTGIDIIYKSLADNTKGTNPPPLKWFNYLSQIRCVNYLLGMNIEVIAVESVNGKSPLDFQLKDGRYGEIKSFSTIDQRTEEPYSLDEYVLKYFSEKKLQPAFEKQKADLVIIDNIFSHYSKQYGLLDYFLSFIGEPEIKDRYALIQKYIGNYLPNILYISFIESITVSPVIKYAGKSFEELGIK